MFLRNKELKKILFQCYSHLTLQSAEEGEGHGEGVGDVTGQSECATASTMMTHLVPCECSPRVNWPCSHEERTDFPVTFVRE